MFSMYFHLLEYIYEVAEPKEMPGRLNLEAAFVLTTRQ